MAVEVSPVPNAPQVIHGLIDYHGMVVPVINLRCRLQLPEQPIRRNDIFIIADTSIRKIALVADAAKDVISIPGIDRVSSARVDPGIEAGGILRLDDGIILIYDIEKFLSGKEEKELQEAITMQNKERHSV